MVFTFRNTHAWDFMCNNGYLFILMGFKEEVIFFIWEKKFQSNKIKRNLLVIKEIKKTLLKKNSLYTISFFSFGWCMCASTLVCVYRVWTCWFGELITTDRHECVCMCFVLTCGLDSSITTNMLILYSLNVHLFVMYLIVYVVLVRVWGLRDVIYLYLYFLQLEVPEKEVYGSSAWGVYFNG